MIGFVLGIFAGVGLSLTCFALWQRALLSWRLSSSDSDQQSMVALMQVLATSLQAHQVMTNAASDANPKSHEP